MNHFKKIAGETQKDYLSRIKVILLSFSGKNIDSAKKISLKTEQLETMDNSFSPELNLIHQYVQFTTDWLKKKKSL